MAGILVVLDGLQDHAYPSLDGKTPYDYGKGENFTHIQNASAVGSLVTTPAGFEADTQTCVLTLLGVQSEDIPSGRSYIEAQAIGMPVGDNDIVMRCNFVKISEDNRMEIATCSAPDDVAKALRAEVAAQPGVTLRPVGSYKSLQCIADGADAVEMRTYPPHNYVGEPLEKLLPSGNAMADQLATFSRRMLEKYKPYTVFNWAQAVPCKLPQFTDLHDGLTGAMVSATDAPVGGAVVMGMACARPDTATGDIDTDLAAKVQATLELARTNDVVMLHIGGPDEATHRKNEKEKAEFVRKMDTELIAPLLEGCPDGTRIMLTCDHRALCSTTGHTDEPVGFLLYEKGKTLSGNLGEFPGVKAVDILMGK